MLDLEWLPEFLVQTPEPEASEGEVIIAAFDLDGGEPLGLLRGQAAFEGPVYQEHGVISDRVDRRDDAEEPSARPERGVDRVEGPVDQAKIGHDDRVDRDGDVDLAGDVVEL